MSGRPRPRSAARSCSPGWCWRCAHGATRQPPRGDDLARAFAYQPRMTQFDLTEDQLAIQEMAQRFTADMITPHAAAWDEQHHFPRDVVKAAAALGFGAIYVSEDAGGIGLGRLESALIMEAMAYGCPSTSAFISIHNMAAWMIDAFGAAELKARYLPDMIACDRLGSYCL